MNTAKYDAAWEYQQFVFEDWQDQLCWSCQTGENRTLDQYAEPQARHYFWDQSQESIQKQLERWTATGWEPLGTVGPESIELQKTEHTETGIDLEHILLWIFTLGVALVIEAFTGIMPRRYIRFVPTQFRIQMRRLRDIQLPEGDLGLENEFSETSEPIPVFA